jgi:hypothetical protein
MTPGVSSSASEAWTALEGLRSGMTIISDLVEVAATSKVSITERSSVAFTGLEGAHVSKDWMSCKALMGLTGAEAPIKP